MVESMKHVRASFRPRLEVSKRRLKKRESRPQPLIRLAAGGIHAKIVPSFFGAQNISFLRINCPQIYERWDSSRFGPLSSTFFRRAHSCCLHCCAHLVPQISTIGSKNVSRSPEICSTRVAPIQPLCQRKRFLWMKHYSLA
jgi:hypothetical protein